MSPSNQQQTGKRPIGRLAVGSIVALAILATLALGWVRWGGPVKRRVKEWMKSDASRVAEAAAAYEARDWAKAAELARPVVKAQADNLDALRILARASARMEHDKTAAAIYTGRLGGAPLQTEDYFLVGLMNARAGQIEKAVTVWDQGARQGDDNPELLENLAIYSARMQRLDEAADAARRLSRKPSWESRGLFLLGEILAMLDDPSGSALALREALERNPTASGATFSLSQYRKRFARSLLQLGRPSEAREPLEAIGAEDGMGGLDPEAEWLLSRAWLQSGNLKEAQTALSLAGSYRAENPLIAEPSPYAGGASCVTCHHEAARGHEKSRHARTFHHGRGLLDLPLPDRPLADPDDSKVMHKFTRDKDTIKVETQVGEKAYQLLIEYAFGTRDGYVTMVGRDAEKTYRAARLSSYHTAAGAQWVGTAGDVPEAHEKESIRGVPIKVRDGVVRCVYCHVTFYRDFRDPPPEMGTSLAAGDSGIGCERCHGPGGNHIKAIKANLADTAIVNAGNGGALAIGKLCADCHIVGSPVEISNAPEDSRFVRSPALTLTFSRCFTESDGALSCMTCHDPHRDDQGDALFFESKCLSCHSAPGGKFSVCRVNPKSKCLECHMVKVPMASLHRDLTDHFIRVHDRSTKK